MSDVKVSAALEAWAAAGDDWREWYWSEFDALADCPQERNPGLARQTYLK